MFSLSKRKTPYFFKFIITTLLACILPTVILSYIYYTSITKNIKDKMYKGFEEVVTLIQNTVDMQLSSIYQIPTTLSADREIYKYLNSEYDALKSTDIQKRLSGYIVSNNLINNLLIYSKYHNYICSAKGIYPVKDSETTPKVNNEPIVSLFNINEISSLRHYQLYPIAEPSIDILALKFPIYYDTLKTSLYSVVTIDCWELRKIVLSSSTTSDNLNRNIFITDSKNNLIVSLINYDNIDSENVLKTLKIESQKDTVTLKNNGKQYIVSYTKPINNKFNVISVIPEEYVSKSLHEQNVFFIIILIITMILIAVVVSVFTQINYSPIKQLKDISEKVLIDTGYKHDEIDSIKTALKYLLDKVNTLNLKIEDNMDAIKARAIEDIINGKYLCKEALNEQMSHYGMNFPHNNFVVAIFNFRNLEAAPNGFIAEIEKHINKVSIGYEMSNIDKNQLIFILNLESNNLNSVIENLNNAKYELENNFSCVITIGIGNIYDNLQLVGKSYIEAKTAIDYRLILGEKVISFCSIKELPENKNANYLQPKDFGDLQSAILDTDLKAISNILDEKVSYIRNNQISLFHARCICFDIINSVIKALSKLSNRNFSFDESYIINLGDFVTIEDLTETIKRIGNQINEFLNHSDRKNADFHIKDIKEYINQNFITQDFSVQEVSENFGMSLSMLSQYFKANTNQTVIDYVTELRIKKAKELLINSDMFINDIVHDIGYYSCSTFIKKFKQITGQTPGEYRELYKKDNPVPAKI